MIYSIFYIFLLAVAALCAWQISAIDLRRRIIPDVYLFPLLLIGVFFTATTPNWHISMTDAATAGIVGYAIATGLGYLFERHAIRQDNAAPNPIGMGDVKLIATGGIWLGASGMAIALCLSYIGALIWAQRKKQKYVPFAPFFVTGGILAFLINLFLL